MKPSLQVTTSNDAPASSNPAPWSSRWLGVRISISEVEIERAPFNICAGFGDVFRGRHPEYGVFALKRLRTGSEDDNTGRVRRFKREAETWETLVHPYVLPFLGIHLLDDHIYLMSPYSEHGTVIDYLARNPLSDRPKFLREIASALAFLHSKSIIHGDLKGRNVLVCPNLSAQVCDFGLARYADGRTSTSIKGGGTTRWSSPEILDNQPKTYASDVYAFGITVAEILSGEPPFSEYASDVAVVKAVVLKNQRPSRTPLKSADGTPYDKEWEVAEQCWAEEARDRPSMVEVISKLAPSSPQTAPAPSVNVTIDRRRPTTPAKTPRRPKQVEKVVETTDIQQSSLRRKPHILGFSVEVLLRILTACWKDQEEGSAVHFPTVASHVCRMWRRRAIATPKFWTVLKFELSAAPTDKHAVWLERSKDYPLDIIIESQSPVEYNVLRHVRTPRVVMLLVPHIRRWRSLRVCWDSENAAHPILDWLSREAPETLERLELMKIGNQSEYEGLSVDKIPGLARMSSSEHFPPFSRGRLPPKLRHIVLDQVPPQYYVNRFRNLQVLEIKNSNASGAQVIRDILSGLPELRTLHVSAGFLGQYIAAPGTPLSLVTHHSLTELSLQVSEDVRDAVMSSLVLPKLRFLLQGARTELTLGNSCLPHLARNHPFPELVSLRLGQDGGLLVPLIELDATEIGYLAVGLKGLGQLRALTFDCVDFGGGQHLYDLGITCPRLRWLKLEDCWGYTLGSLLTIVVQRRSRAEELDSLVRIVVRDEHLPEGTVEELEELERLAGFKHVKPYCSADPEQLEEHYWVVKFR